MKEMVGGCCVCSDERGWDENPLVYCDGHGCNVAVHQGTFKNQLQHSEFSESPHWVNRDPYRNDSHDRKLALTLFPVLSLCFLSFSLIV